MRRSRSSRNSTLLTPAIAVRGGVDDVGGLGVGVGDCIVVGDLLVFGRRRVGIVTTERTEGGSHHCDHWITAAPTATVAKTDALSILR